MSNARRTSGSASIVAFIAAGFSSEYTHTPSMIPLTTSVHKWSKNSKDLGSSTFTVSLSHTEIVNQRRAGVSGSDRCERAVLRDLNEVNKTRRKNSCEEIYRKNEFVDSRSPEGFFWYASKHNGDDMNTFKLVFGLVIIQKSHRRWDKEWPEVFIHFWLEIQNSKINVPKN